jgi:hypothetical protein
MQKTPRRTLLKSAAVAMLVPGAYGWADGYEQAPVQGESETTNILGAYGKWAAEALQDPPRLSFRKWMFTDPAAWRQVARSQFRERLIKPGGAATPAPVMLRQFEFDGLSMEHFSGSCRSGLRRKRCFSNRPVPGKSCRASWDGGRNEMLQGTRNYPARSGKRDLARWRRGPQKARSDHGNSQNTHLGIIGHSD